jgi:CheY-like chemotaxis protein/glycine cleavage system H lipoate-binding protein
MAVLIVILTFLVFIAADLVVRLTTRRLAERRIRREREAALATSLRLDFTHEAPSLKRVGVDQPKARILAVDDEPVILDALRKILVLEGCSVDTVESGPEALGLVQRNDYDFVFTDLKMPGMDGAEVVKGVKHLRPDVDVVVITGYATVESAVDTMQHGAMDYVQKPFTADELVQFVRRLAVRRQARLDAQRLPQIRLITPGHASTARAGELCVPGGAFLSNGHAWARIEPSGQVRIGLDDFAGQVLGNIEGLELPAVGSDLRRGDALLTLHRSGSQLRIATPISGRVAAVNATLGAHPTWVTQSPYDGGWVCVVEPTDLIGELPALRIGKPVIDWYQEEIARLRQLGGSVAPDATALPWTTLQQQFFPAT